VSLAEATAKLEQKVKPLQNPVQTLTVTVDNIDIAPGDVATVRIPQLTINSDFQAVSVKVKFLKNAVGLSYSRTTITFGKRKRELFDTGEDGEAGPPDDLIEPPPPQPPTNLILDTTWGIGGWIYGEVGTASGRFAFTPPTHAPRQYHIEVYQGVNRLVDAFDIPGTMTGFSTHALNIGETYTFYIWSKNNVLSDDYASDGPLTVPAPGAQHVLNPSFETNDSGATSNIRNWTSTQTNGGTVTQDTTPHTGTYAAKLTTTGTSGSIAKVTSDPVLVRATRYVLQFYAKSPDLVPLGRGVAWFQNDGTPISTVSTSPPALTTTYPDEPYTVTISTPPGAGYFKVFFTYSTLSSTAYVFDVSCEPQQTAAMLEGGDIAGLTFASLVKWSNT
jgi:hypothetical protein